MYRVLGADGKEYGPVNAETLGEWFTSSQANAQTKVKPEGAADWQTLGSLPEFAALFSAAPGASAMPPPVPAQFGEAKTSGMAITSLVLGILGVFTCGVTALVGLVLGIVSLVRINRSGGRLSGKGLAIAGICSSGVFLLMLPIWAALMLPALARAKAKAQSINCVNNVKQLDLGILLYSQANGTQLPPANSWCDAILPNVASPRVFLCPAATGGGRCHYAFNQKLGGLSLNKITNPSRTVMIFESDGGWSPGGGWNASGGRQLVIGNPRHSRRVVVGFADGHVEQIAESELDQLIWEP
jgi:prepilin-type processing-associated H-X9-DG protein